MIFADTDILSALAKIGRLSVLYTLLQITVLYITPSVLREIEHSFILRRQYAIDLFALLASGQLEMVRLSSDEVAAQNSLPHTLGAGERESIAAARVRAGQELCSPMNPGWHISVNNTASSVYDYRSCCGHSGWKT
jgi:predicted nucleic acid-binding protein